LRDLVSVQQQKLAELGGRNEALLLALNQGDELLPVAGISPNCVLRPKLAALVGAEQALPSIASALTCDRTCGTISGVDNAR
jgi:hypothetical protein